MDAIHAMLSSKPFGVSALLYMQTSLKFTLRAFRAWPWAVRTYVRKNALRLYVVDKIEFVLYVKRLACSCCLCPTDFFRFGTRIYLPWQAHDTNERGSIQMPQKTHLGAKCEWWIRCFHHSPNGTRLRWLPIITTDYTAAKMNENK